METIWTKAQQVDEGKSGICSHQETWMTASHFHFRIKSLQHPTLHRLACAGNGCNFDFYCAANLHVNARLWKLVGFTVS